MKTFIYVDAFNLYFGAVRGTPYKWLDLDQLCRILLPRHEIVQIKYFTARVNARPSDPDQPTRQATYLSALSTLPHLTIYYGHFLTHKEDLRKPVGVINPQHIPCRVLQNHATFYKHIRKSALDKSQFPSPMKDAKGSFFKPYGW